MTRVLPIVAAILGIAAIMALVVYFGAGAVLNSLLAVGAAGFAAVCGIHVVIMILMGLAWAALLPASRPWVAIWGRFVRDSGSEVLPLSQVGGYVLGARAISVAGVPARLAAASTIIDMTLEFLAQLAYTAVGLICLLYLRPDSAAARPVFFGLLVAGAAAGAFVLFQHRGLAYVDRIARILGRGWTARSAAGAAALHSALADIYRRRAGLGLSFLLHLACWIGSAAEAWIALRFAGVALPFGAVVAIESLLYAIRAGAFFVPNAVGVQEGAYILLGAGFGLTPEMALALSFLKRARDLAIGLPSLAIWPTVEGSRLWRRVSARPMPAVPPER